MNGHLPSAADVHIVIAIRSQVDLRPLAEEVVAFLAVDLKKHQLDVEADKFLCRPLQETNHCVGFAW